MVTIFSNYLSKNGVLKGGNKQQQKQLHMNRNENENVLHSPRQHPGAVLLGNTNASTAEIGLLDSFSNDLRLTSVKSNFSNTNFDPFYGGNTHQPHDDIISITKEEQLLTANNHRGSLVVNFNQDLSNFIYWINTLSTSEQNNVIDNLLPSLNEDVLQYTKMKLDSLTKTGYLSPTNMGSPMMSYNQPMVSGFDLNEDVSPIINDYPIAATMSAPQLPTVSPLMNANGPMNQQQQKHQLVNHTGYENIQMNSLDYLMGQPSDEDTISRVNSTATNSQQINSVYDYLSETKRPITPVVSNEQLRRQQKSYSPIQDQSNILNNRTRNSGLIQPHHSNITSGNNAAVKSPKKVSSSQSQKANTIVAATQGANSTMSKDVLCQERLLDDIPAWLKTLRLHKYTPILGAYSWKELIEFDDAKLEELGVNALGARNKLLKAFNVVKEGKQ